MVIWSHKYSNMVLLHNKSNNDNNKNNNIIQKIWLTFVVASDGLQPGIIFLCNFCNVGEPLNISYDISSNCVKLVFEFL